MLRLIHHSERLTEHINTASDQTYLPSNTAQYELASLHDQEIGCGCGAGTATGHGGRYNNLSSGQLQGPSDDGDYMSDPRAYWTHPQSLPPFTA